MVALDQRIEDISQDNYALREENRQLTAKVRELQQEKITLREFTVTVPEDSRQSLLGTASGVSKIGMFKPKTRTVVVGVTEEDIK